MQVELFAEFDARVSVYTGGCDALSCLATNDQSPVPGPESSLSVNLENGQMYYILVHGVGTSAGDYNLVVKTLDPAENDDCTDATELNFGVSESGTTFSASSTRDLPFCGV